MQEPEVNQALCTAMLRALVLRIQSGSDARHNGIAEVTWDKVAQHEYVVALQDHFFSVLLKPTKLISPKNAAPVEFFLADAITSYLFQHWHTLYSPSCSKQNAGHKYVFPKINQHGEFDFQQPFSYDNHKEACMACAQTCGIPVSEQLQKTMGTNAVRRGNAATLGVQIRGEA